jgi:O-antigen ligase
MVYCFGNALYESLIFIDGNLVFRPYSPIFTYENYFYGWQLSRPIHPSYLSMYILVSALVFSELLLERSVSGRVKLLYTALLFFLLASIYFLSSRAGMLAALVIIPAFFFIRLSSLFKWWKLLAPVFIFILIFFSISKTNDRLDYTIQEIMKNIGKENLLKNDIRHSIWNSSVGVIKKNWLFGVGTGDSSNELKKEFKCKGYTEGFYDNLNAHNQFLELWVENGIPGLLLFILIIGWIVYISIQDRNLLLGLFIINMLIFFSFETILNRLGGVTFFPLMLFLLIHHKRR